MKLLFIISLITISLYSSAKLLDKISIVINNEVVTLSQIERVKKNIPARKNISPFVYSKDKYTNKEIAKIIVNGRLIRSKLKSIHIMISDEHVEAEIKAKEKALGLSRTALLQFLEGHNTTYEEFFEITREAIEFGQFNGRVIAPLISITDQEIKNKYFKENSNNKTLAFKYTLVDFSIDQKIVGKNKKGFVDALKRNQTSGVIPKKYQSLKTNVLGDITEGGLAENLKTLLKKTDEGSFSAPINLYGETHVFYVKKKDLVESGEFLKHKERIRQELFAKKATKASESWYQREIGKHYIKFFL